ncbi:unnamed protein product [Chilo suppressalis]|uniref:Uncharacterized protein n=1 Tax=Chilo suppressalis TaxID=168631 RepID=A0ABN8B8U9_CHISP|nr:unnamed protein product [Chilo suppressalis]
MRNLCLILLSLCALANTTPLNLDDNYFDGVTSVRNLKDLELYTSLAPDSDTEDYIAEYFSSLDIQQRNVIAQIINDALEGFRDVIVNGNDNIPPLDPFVIDQIGPFLYTALGVRATAEIRNLRVEGLRWFVVDHITFNPLRLLLGVQVTIPRITVTGSYDARARITLISHRAGGNFRVFAHRIIFGLNMRLGTSLAGGHLFLRQLDIKIDIHDTFISIEGMTGSSILNALINSFVQSITQDVIQNEMENNTERG